MKASGPVNRVELECQVLCAALRQSWVRQDKVGAFTSIRELSHLFPDLLPPPEEKERDVSNKANYYEVLSVRPQSGLNAIMVGYLRRVRNFLKERNPKDNKVEFNTILNAGFVLRKPRLRLSHDLVVARRWLYDSSESKAMETTELPLPRAMELAQQASVATPPPVVQPPPVQSAPAEPVRQQPPQVPPPQPVAVEQTPEPVPDVAAYTPPVYTPPAYTPPAFGEPAAQQSAPVSPSSEPLPFAEVAAEQAWPDEDVPSAPSSAAASVEQEPAPAPVNELPVVPPPITPVPEVPAYGNETYAQPSGLTAAAEVNPPPVEAPGVAANAVAGSDAVNPQFVFDESQLRKPEAKIDVPPIIRLMEAAHLISQVEVQALKAQIQLAPNIAAEQLVLNAGYATRQEISSLHLAQDLLARGRISMAQFQVAMYDERTSGLRMAESLQVRGWLETEVRNTLEG